MRFLFRWIFRLVVLAVLVGVALFVFRDAILEEITEQRLSARTGLDVRIDRLELALLKPTVTIEGFRVYNPSEFGGGAFLDLRELHVEYHRKPLAQGRMRFKLLRVDLDEMTLVRGRDGRWNFQEIGERINARRPEYEEPLAFAGIDVLNLSVGQVKRVDLEAGGAARVYRADLRDELFTELYYPSDYVKAASRLALKLGLKSLTKPSLERGDSE